MGTGTTDSYYGQETDKILRCIRRRRSEGINIKPASNLYHAPRVAKALGNPLTQFLTVNLEQVGVGPEEASETVALLMQRYLKWVARPRRYAGWSAASGAYAWVLENDEVVGVHAHCMLHLPTGSETDFLDRAEQWLSRITGQAVEAPTIDLREAPNPENLAYYFIKGARREAAAFFNREHVPQGEIIGKRSGTSMNIGRSAKVRLRGEGRYPAARNRYNASRYRAPS